MRVDFTRVIEVCLIVDTCVAHLILTRTDDLEFKPVHDAIFGMRRRTTLVYGGKLAREYEGNKAVRRVVLTLDRSGRARKESDEKVDAETKRLERQKLCRSNDQHIIALARVGAVRLLCTHDKNSGLMADFKRKSLLDNPRGSVYTRNTQRHLIAQHCDCTA